MTHGRAYDRWWRRFAREESGTTMVEFAICIALFLLILFAILDFGRLGYNWVVAEKAMQRAARIAAVRPPVCPNVPVYHVRGIGDSATYPAGTLCNTNGGVCVDPGARQCTLGDANLPTDGQATANEMWAALEPLMPQGTTASNILVRYEYDPRLGFVGGPYVPIITARIVGTATNNGYNELPFTFITPLSALAANAGDGNVDDIPGSIPFPGISVTIPAEDMNQGMNG